MAHVTDSLSILQLREDKPWMHGIAGLISGSVAMMMFYPLDLLRTRMHIFNQRDGVKPLPHSIRMIVSHEGFRGMYRGMTISVLTHGLGWATYLVTFRVAQSYLGDLLGHFVSISDFLSACAAAVLTATLITPFYVMKTWHQLQGSIEESSMALMMSTKRPLYGLNLVHYLRGREGRRAMFRGFGPQVLLTSTSTIQVTLYEWFRRRHFSESHDPSITEVALGSALAKAITCGVFNPLEVVRTRLQYVKNQHRPEYSNMRLGLQTIWRNEGFSGMFRGYLTNLTRVIPTTVVSFVLYEKLLRVIRSPQCSISVRWLWGQSYDFLKNEECLYIGYDELVPEYVNFFSGAI